MPLFVRNALWFVFAVFITIFLIIPVLSYGTCAEFGLFCGIKSPYRDFSAYHPSVGEGYQITTNSYTDYDATPCGKNRYQTARGMVTMSEPRRNESDRIRIFSNGRAVWVGQ